MAKAPRVQIRIALAIAAVALIIILTWVAKATGTLDAFMAFGTVGTAVGTLGLAAYTYRLAGATIRSVEGADRMASLAERQLDELQEQRAVIVIQAEKAGEQAEATRDLAEVSGVTAKEAARARIDAIAPLVDMQVRLGTAWVSGPGDAGARRGITEADSWYEAQLKDHAFGIVLRFRFKNVGASPAQVAFGDTSTELVGVAAGEARGLTLGHGQEYEDVLRVHFAGDDARQPRLLRIPVTYNGLLHGEMFDHIQWNGWVTPLREVDGRYVLNEWESIVNSAGAQVVRSYPNLDQPEMMAEGRARMLGREEPGGST